MTQTERLRKEREEERAYGYEYEKYIYTLYGVECRERPTLYAHDLQEAIYDVIDKLKGYAYYRVLEVVNVLKDNNRAIIKAKANIGNHFKIEEKELTAVVELYEFY